MVTKGVNVRFGRRVIIPEAFTVTQGRPFEAGGVRVLVAVEGKDFDEGALCFSGLGWFLIFHPVLNRPAAPICVKGKFTEIFVGVAGFPVFKNRPPGRMKPYGGAAGGELSLKSAPLTDARRDASRQNWLNSPHQGQRHSSVFHAPCLTVSSKLQSLMVRAQDEMSRSRTPVPCLLGRCRFRDASFFPAVP